MPILCQHSSQHYPLKEQPTNHTGRCKSARSSDPTSLNQKEFRMAGPPGQTAPPLYSTRGQQFLPVAAGHCGRPLQAVPSPQAHTEPPAPGTLQRKDTSSCPPHLAPGGARRNSQKQVSSPLCHKRQVMNLQSQVPGNDDVCYFQTRELAHCLPVLQLPVLALTALHPASRGPHPPRGADVGSGEHPGRRARGGSHRESPETPGLPSSSHLASAPRRQRTGYSLPAHLGKPDSANGHAHRQRGQLLLPEAPSHGQTSRRCYQDIP